MIISAGESDVCERKDWKRNNHVAKCKFKIHLVSAIIDIIEFVHQ